MRLPLFQIDAFTDQTFSGNPACVVPLESWLPDETMLKIANENAVAETAFFIDNGDKIHLRWFTPDIEMDLCGHATLATAHCLRTMLDYPNTRIVFESLSGELVVTYENDRYFLNFPSRMPVEADLPELISKSLSIQPKEVYKARDYLLVYDSENEVRDIRIDRNTFDQVNLDPGGVIVTARGENSDFVSRFFTPQATNLEDPVTGSAHCSLIPFWSKQLGKKKMLAFQLSKRGGKLYCEDSNERVMIGGNAVTYSSGELLIG